MTDKHPPVQPAPPRSFGLVDHRAHWEHLKRHLPPWKQKLLAVSLIVAVIGFGGQISSWVLRKDAPVSTANAPLPKTQQPAPAPHGGGNGFVSGAPQANAPVAAPSVAPPTAAPSGHSLTDKLTPWMGKIGISFFVGVVLGTLFRTFLKLMALGAVVIAGGLGALSYFHILNVDLSRMKTQYASSTAWVEDQAGKLKDVAVGALPSSTSAMAGFFAGFKKR